MVQCIILHTILINAMFSLTIKSTNYNTNSKVNLKIRIMKCT